MIRINIFNDFCKQKLKLQLGFITDYHTCVLIVMWYTSSNKLTGNGSSNAIVWS